MSKEILRYKSSGGFSGISGEKKKHSQRITALKCTRTSFPPVISSYCTKTDGGRGEQRMWQVANFLKRHGIASFNGKQVKAGEDWMQKWLGKMPEADVCLAMIGPDYFKSGP